MSLAAEALLAVTGVFRSKPISASDGDRAVKLPDAWRAQIRRVLLDQTKEFKAPGRVDVVKMWERLNDPPTTSERARLVEDMEGGELPAEYFAALDRAYQYLQSVWPVSKIERTFRPVFLQPSPLETWRASGIWEVANDPGAVIDRMLSRSLTSEDVTTMREIYPELYKMATEILSVEASKIAQSRPAYDPSPATDYALRTFLGIAPDVPISRISGDPPEKVRAPDLTTELKFDEAQTKAQRLENK